MIIFKREIENQIRNALFKKSMVVILGPRQSGKTTLSKKIIVIARTILAMGEALFGKSKF